MNRKPQRGVALIEFALILPLLLILAMIVTEFGRALYLYNSAAKSVRDAVRYLSLQTPKTHITEASNLVVYGNIHGDGEPLDNNLNTSHVVINDDSWKFEGTAPAINTVTVRVTGYQFRPMLSGMFGVTFGTLTFSDITATMRSQI
ncbi:TadE/TadG family type IV pilus assembly protein [Pseudoduganella sp. GCM10020061]|uniref:TadE/TadG family type IV pilus assembly protein n=1 Tax=Pseudoduganella sp. GCM10020061 TaxID=3317345 RepID=UPI0036363EBB